MKYTIVTLIKGETEKYQQNLIYDIAKKFNINEAILRKPPAHITLKYSFEIEDIIAIENTIYEFCKINKVCNYKLKNISNFDKDVIFIDVLPSFEMDILYSKLIDCLKKIPTLKFKNFDGKTHFHSTIAFRNIEDKFDAILEYLANEKPDFDIRLDNIAILIQIEGIWQIHKEYSLS